MYKKGIGDFRYYSGISSLAQVATRSDRVCVVNILGGESSEVTPVSHVYSGGNVVFGTSPGRAGSVLETEIGDIPVYSDVIHGMRDGLSFNCGVVYLPPAAAKHGVFELMRVNPEVKKIFVVTEKIPAHDARLIRAMAQAVGVDVFGANSLGVADSWNHVRIGGALGGNTPSEALRKGSIAVFSNSGNFTTTIATYLRMAGWGTTTLISSGKDVYIHYAAPEFAFALANDMRTKAAVLYVEPGGYYELDAQFTKPVVACVVGRWKSTLTRAVGHAGALAGGGDSAADKERWFIDKLGVDGIYTPEHPICSAMGAVVTNIAHIPQALTDVMALNATRPDFAPEGSLELKAWFGDNRGLLMPPELDLPVVTAAPPYEEQIASLNSQIGALLPRQSMRNASGASQMDPTTQVSSLRGVTVLDAATQPMEANIVLALLGRRARERDRALVNAAVTAYVNLHGSPALAAAQAARDAGDTPNTTIAAAVALQGPRRSAAARNAVVGLVDLFGHSGIRPDDEALPQGSYAPGPQLWALLVADEPDPRAQAMLDGLERRGVRTVLTDWLRDLGGEPTEAGVLAVLTTSLAWEDLMDKHVSRLTVEELPWWMQLFGTVIGASAPAEQHQEASFHGIPMEEVLGERTVTELAATTLLGQVADPRMTSDLAMLTGLLLTNGPGSITAQGAKGAVASDGPQTPQRVQLNKAMLGFLSHCGYSHGGNGYEGIAFLDERFRDTDLHDPADPDHGVDLDELAHGFAREFIADKAERKRLGTAERAAIPCINHPVFKGKPVNVDPREEFVRIEMAARGEYNVFHDFYSRLVKALHEEGATKNVFCVNVDALTATLLLGMLWERHRRGELGESELESAAFTAFVFGRMIGCAAEVDDHQNRGRNMDTRIPPAELSFVS